jgi:hypothetical protein
MRAREGNHIDYVILSIVQFDPYNGIIWICQSILGSEKTLFCVQIAIGEMIIICFANLIPESCEGMECIYILTKPRILLRQIGH